MRRMRHKLAMHTPPSRCARSAVLLLIVIAATRVDAQAVRATILGTVRDSTGAALPGVSVEARHVATGGAQTVVSNEQGRFNLPDLPLGTYEVQASIAGF